MATNEERLRILKMVQEGKITAEEAAQLLQLLEDAAGKTTSPGRAATASAGRQGRWLRVRVTDTDSGKTRVNVRLPLSMVSAGMKMGMRLSPEVEGLDPEMLNQFINSGQVGQVVDVFDEEGGEHVEVFIE